jgi:hypothetical protein
MSRLTSVAQPQLEQTMTYRRANVNSGMKNTQSRLPVSMIRCAASSWQWSQRSLATATSRSRGNTPMNRNLFRCYERRLNVASIPRWVHDGGTSVDIRAAFWNRRALRASVGRVLDWDFDQLVLAHGPKQTSGAKPFVERALAWALGSSVPRPGLDV